MPTYLITTDDVKHRCMTTGDGELVFPFTASYISVSNQNSTEIMDVTGFHSGQGKSQTLAGWLRWAIGNTPHTTVSGDPVSFRCIDPKRNTLLLVTNEVVEYRGYKNFYVRTEIVDLFDLLIGMPEARPIGVNAFVVFLSGTMYMCIRAGETVDVFQVMKPDYLTNPDYFKPPTEETPKVTQPVKVERPDWDIDLEDADED